MLRSPASPRVSILVVDDNPASLRGLTTALAAAGREVLGTAEPASGLDRFRWRRPQIVVLNILCKASGLDTLEQIMDEDAATAVIFISAAGEEGRAETMAKGAAVYLCAPVCIDDLRAEVEKLSVAEESRQRSLQLSQNCRTQAAFLGLIGRSPRMEAMLARVERVAGSYRSLLISGETGTGKDVVARVIHKLSPVSATRYVVLNCSAVVEELFESELFGHVKGAFTGADFDKPGLFEHADGGTLFLDEIGDMPLNTQAKLLRVLQEREVRRVGALVCRKIDVRVIVATNQDLRKAVTEKRFRGDLYYRLSMIEIQVPRLADRREDLPILQSYFVERFAAQYGKHLRHLTQRACQRFIEHSWPGNVRELENAIGYAAMMADTDEIDIGDLPDYFRSDLVKLSRRLDGEEADAMAAAG